jgi:hypothetical protein
VLLSRIWKVPEAAIETDILRGPPQFFQANAEFILYVTPRSLSAISFPIHYSPITPSSGTLSSELLRGSLKKLILSMGYIH